MNKQMLIVILVILLSLLIIACSPKVDIFELEGESDSWTGNVNFEESDYKDEGYIGKFVLNYKGEKDDSVDSIEYQISILGEDTNYNTIAKEIDLKEPEETIIFCSDCKFNDNLEIKVEVQWDERSETFIMEE